MCHMALHLLASDDEGRVVDERVPWNRCLSQAVDARSSQVKASPGHGAAGEQE